MEFNFDELMSGIDPAGTDRNCDCNFGIRQDTGQPCDKCNDGIERKEQIEEERRIESLRHIQSKLADIPSRFRRYTFDDFAECHDVFSVHEWSHYLDRNLVLWGPNGTGKTSLVFAAIRDALPHIKDFTYYQFDDLLLEIRNTYSSYEDASYIYRSCKEATILFLDDLGNADAFTQATDHTITTLNTILDYRYARELPVAVTSNLAPEEIRNRYGMKVHSRLFDGAIERNLTGQIFAGV